MTQYLKGIVQVPYKSLSSSAASKESVFLSQPRHRWLGILKSAVSRPLAAFPGKMSDPQYYRSAILHLQLFGESSRSKSLWFMDIQCTFLSLLLFFKWSSDWQCQLSRSRSVLSDLEKRPRKWQTRLVAKSRSQTEPASRPALGLLLTFLLSPPKDILHIRLGDADVVFVADLSCWLYVRYKSSSSDCDPNQFKQEQPETQVQQLAKVWLET